jgi:hypothetical protein
MNNKIGDEGTQYLAEALQNNTVRQVLVSSNVYLPFLFNTETYQTHF